MIKRIAITGPESTGKSELAKSLAQYYNTVWVPEVARRYLDNLGREYNYDDILMIAKKQIDEENKLAKTANGFLFCDTDLIVTKIWCEYKYGRCHPWILEQIEKHKYDLYLLTNIDLPWQPDPLREHPDKRKEIFELYLKELKQRKFPFEIISGLGSDRVENAVQLINRKFENIIS